MLSMNLSGLMRLLNIPAQVAASALAYPIEEVSVAVQMR
jgi:hypothetical protein